MGLIKMDCWECELCGYIWLKVKGRDPKRCASRACRKRAWNKAVNTPADVQVHVPKSKPSPAVHSAPRYVPPRFSGK